MQCNVGLKTCLKWSHLAEFVSYSLIDKEEAHSEVSKGGATSGLQLRCLCLFGDHGGEGWHSVFWHRESHTGAEDILTYLDMIIIRRGCSWSQLRFERLPGEKQVCSIWHWFHLPHISRTNQYVYTRLSPKFELCHVDCKPCHSTSSPHNEPRGHLASAEAGPCCREGTSQSAWTAYKTRHHSWSSPTTFTTKIWETSRGNLFGWAEFYKAAGGFIR